MTDREIMQQALEALKKCRYRSLADEIVDPAITALTERLAQHNEFNPDWDAMAVIVEEQQRMAKRIAELEAQPEQEPKCGAIIEVFGKDWRLDYMSLPVGKHKLYTQQYTYTAPPQRKPLPPQSPCEMTQAEGKMFKLGWLECEAAHGIKENT